MTQSSGPDGVPEGVSAHQFHMDQDKVVIERGGVSDRMWGALGATVEHLLAAGAEVTYGSGEPLPPPAPRITADPEDFVAHAASLDRVPISVATDAYQRLVESFVRQMASRRFAVERELPPIFFGEHPAGPPHQWDMSQVRKLDVESLHARVRVIDEQVDRAGGTVDVRRRFYRRMGHLVSVTTVNFWRSFAEDAISKAEAAKQAEQTEEG